MGDLKGKYSDIKNHFKKFNKANQNDLQELVKLTQESKVYEISNKAKTKDISQTQQQQPQPKQIVNSIQSQKDIPNKMAALFQNNNQPANPQPPGNQQIIPNKVERFHSSQSSYQLQQSDQVKKVETQQQKLPQPKVDQQEEENVKQQQQQQKEKPLEQPIPISKDTRDSQYENKNNRNNILNNQSNSYRFDNKNNDNSNTNNSQPTPAIVEDQSNFVKYEGPQFIKILQFNENIIFIDENTVYQQIYQGITEDKKTILFSQQTQELSMERLKKIYQLPISNKKIYKIINATVHEQILCLQIYEQELNSQDDEDSGYGFVFLNFIYDENEQISNIKAQMIKQVDTNPIKCFQLDQEKEIFFYSIEAGFLFCFGFDLSYKFCYQVPEGQHITNFFYDSSNQGQDIIVYSTNQGALYQLRFRLIPEFQVIQEEHLTQLIDAQKISYLGLSFDRQSMLVLHTKSGISEATVYLYPSFKKQRNFETINSNQYVQLYDFVVSFTQTNLNYEFFGLLSTNQIAIYCYELEEDSNKLKQNLVYTKQIGFSPQCMYFSLDGFASKLIRIYYNNPDRLKQESQQEICRLILDKIDSQFK
ncbi:hypothetical protein TTHERM_00125260 (macronuclear) [Tetrahymena thermophila SB210]|uniref:WD40-repeat-containing domain n=1 Tax=Tetrahymena thermophila (strain SB210) TaxID=312017 RepID=I7MJ50_TETTS|nr:hypothetical protein TTHERM_00125260 [Tetrahymena thermophila SB210]EAR95960.1 hypothetical protein TTHERM_00125260 [Tetrahymena thermophila SB210]|eukprot:XP_001016205.1 hypothetical protein TTHERM_00125260 [Tetrahymena thermophila SB210]